jgi:hypothetical protein
MGRTRIGAAALALLWGLGAWGTDGLLVPPEETWLRIQKPGLPEKPAVRFSHGQHPKNRIACEICHHDYQRGRNLWKEGQPVKKCQSCHGLVPQAGRLDIKNAFHRQCKGCHLHRRKAKQAGGPINCQGCHNPLFN